MKKKSSSRRQFIKCSAFGLIGITSFSQLSARTSGNDDVNANELFYRYPSLSDDIVSTVVGASHSNYEKVKEILIKRPELACASWDWGFGDAETALGAASHVGRRDIAELLMSYGARPDIFTFTMMGMLKSVQEIVEIIPGIQSHTGPHGITLLQHAINRLENKTISDTDKVNVNKVISYLDKLGDADVKPKNIDLTEDEKKKYIGEYRFGDGATEIFIADIHRLGFLQLGRKGSSPRKLNKVGDNIFSPAGAASVKIIFTLQDDKTVSLSVHEPEPLVTAIRI